MRAPRTTRGQKKSPFSVDYKRRKICRFCENKIDIIDYKDERMIRRFVSDRGKIIPRRISGNCARHQRQLTVAIKRGRHLGLLPYTSESYR
ncbi:MAG: 30S ribosomal protein S18 [candidate division Zixibacteria bacterium DG_27]|nr:MAG: 30S ribosomal protein S18 [candidate division Zixibacteria bacterium DG_27]